MKATTDITVKSIKIRGARENNLKNVSVDIPRNKITCIIGLSGSGKSSLAYNILYSEGQRQFLESINTFAARLLKRTQRPDVDSIENLSPTISIDQKRLRGNPRSTVGTTTEIYTYLRLLFSRFGSEKGLSAGHFSFNNPKGACKQCKGLGFEFNIDPHDIVDFDKSLAQGASKHNNYKPGKRLYNVLDSSKKLDMNKKIRDYSEEELHFLLYTERVELSNQDQGFIQRFSHEGIITRLKNRASDLRGQSERKEKSDKPYISMQPCSLCHGGRLNERALKSTISGENIGYYVNLQLNHFIDKIKTLNISGATELINRIIQTTENLIKVKLEYLTINRSLDTLSGGEAQRLKLARELGNDLIEIVYIIDEPTSGLHSYDRENILSIIKGLKKKGNTIIIIEHDEDVMRQADYLIEVGPKAGTHGGEIIYQGELKGLITNSKSITASYLTSSGINIKKNTRTPSKYLSVENANIHNLKNVSVQVPLGVLCTFTGVSGSGKSSLLMDVFAKKYTDQVVVVDQKQLSGIARGNLATYINIFDNIRELFAESNNISKKLFSFNSDGACPECKGLGYKKIDMHFMGDVTVKCESCMGKRFKQNVLDYCYKEKTIADVLQMTVDEAFEFFDDPDIKKGLKTLQEVGLGYLEIGQSHDTLSGGEAQRLKLAKQLNKKGEIYILDEPTSGLHSYDIDNLLKLLNSIVDSRNTVLAIEHNLKFIAQSDWLIDLGPYGGDKGGEIVAEGTPLMLMENSTFPTGSYLKKSASV
ncbi:excinuclease ABC subunit UvrA [Candidatus Dojkabacteria bacterium]|nr:excinuclease ABC subunit UvrA [Candidatus Dojkabacteria bacterium]